MKAHPKYSVPNRGPGKDRRISARVLAQLRRFESRNVTYIAEDGSWPIVWDRARGASVWTPEGRRYLDFTAAFGVAAAGHSNPRVVAAGQRQMETLLHAMGDVHPHRLKAAAARELSRLTFERWARGRSRLRAGNCGLRIVGRLTVGTPSCTGKTIFCNSGFEAVEAGLKTALLATEKPGVIAFEGAYHGLGYGALNVTHRSHFRQPFERQLGEFSWFLPFPDRQHPQQARQQRDFQRALTRLLRKGVVGAILVEPIQGRGGIRVPAEWFLPVVREACSRHGAVMILDEVFTGFGRTGTWFACELSGVVPDLICLGKALTGGFPLSACVGRADLMDRAWPISSGEAIHTSTFLGHPVGCAMLLAQMKELQGLIPGVNAKSRYLSDQLLQAMKSCPAEQVAIRGVGLMLGVEFRRKDGSPDGARALRVVKTALECGLIVLPEGDVGHVVGLTPPLNISRREMDTAVKILGVAIREPGETGD